jgi:putative membrane protein
VTDAGAVPRQGQRLHPLTPLLRGGIFVAAVAFGVLQQVIVDHQFTWPALTLAGALLLGLIYGAFSWWFTRFYIDQEELRIDSGVLVRRSRRIRIERLQAIDVVQPLLARVFSLAELRLEVAGGTKTEAPLAFLPLDEASRLRAVLLAKAHRESEPRAGQIATAHQAPRLAVDAPTRAADTPVAAVGPGMLLVAVLSTTRWLVALVSLIVGLAIIAATGSWVAVALVVPGLLGVGTGILQQFANEFAFTVSSTAQGLRITRGLLDLTSQTVPIERIQAVSIVQPVLWRPMGWVRIQVDIAGYGAGDSAKAILTTTLLPVGKRPVGEVVVARVLPGVDVRSISLAPAPRRSRWVRPIGWWTLGVGGDDRAVVTSQGWLTRVWSVVPHAKMQSVRLHQGPWQRALRLATVNIDSPPGPVRAAALHRPDTEARAIVETQLALSRSARATTPREHR